MSIRTGAISSKNAQHFAALLLPDIKHIVDKDRTKRSTPKSNLSASGIYNNYLAAAKGAPPVIMKLISRISTTKSFNMLAHYLNKKETVALTDSNENDYLYSGEVSDFYSKWKDELDALNKKEDLANIELKKSDIRAFDNVVVAFNKSFSESVKTSADNQKAISRKAMQKQFDSFIQSIKKHPQTLVLESPHHIKKVVDTLLRMEIKKIGKLLYTERQLFKQTKAKKHAINIDLYKEYLNQAHRRLPKTSTLMQHGMVAFPKRTDPAVIGGIVRSSIDDTFGDRGVKYFTAIHTNESGHNPHVHFVIRLDQDNGEKLNIRRNEVMEFRQNIADHAKEHGILLHAGKAYQRGKQAEKTPTKIYKMIASELEREFGKKNVTDERVAKFLAMNKARDATHYSKATRIEITTQERAWKDYIIKQAERVKDEAVKTIKEADKYNDTEKINDAKLVFDYASQLQTALPQRLKILHEIQEKDKPVSRDIDAGIERD